VVSVLIAIPISRQSITSTRTALMAMAAAQIQYPGLPMGTFEPPPWYTSIRMVAGYVLQGFVPMTSHTLP
jgi:hypothetical protein